MYDENLIYDQFGVTLARVREEKGISQAELADLGGFSVPPVSYWETGKRYPTLYSFICVCNALEMNADELLKECMKEVD